MKNPVTYVIVKTVIDGPWFCTVFREKTTYIHENPIPIGRVSPREMGKNSNRFFATCKRHRGTLCLQKYANHHSYVHC